MYFRFPDNPELTNFRVYTSFAEMFTPSVNRIWDTETNLKTLGSWFTFLKAFYTRDNIKSNLGCFLPDMRVYHNVDGDSNGARYTESLLADIPDDYLWMLHFLRYYDYSNGKHYFSVHRLKRADSLNRCEAPDIGMKVGAVNISAATSLELFEAIKTDAKAYLDFFTEYSQRRIDWDYFTTGSGLNLYTMLRTYWTKQLQYRDASNQRTSFTSVCADVNATIKLTENELMVSAGYPFLVQAVRKITRTYRDPLYAIMNYTTNPCHILEWPIIEPGEHKPMLYGVELECTFDYPIKEVIDAAHTPFFIAKQDSSISGGKRMQAELVTVPMSLKALKRHYAHWFKNLDYTKFDVTRDTNNGMHVHMDRAGFDSKRHIQNLSWFYLNPANRDFLIYVSERGTLEAMNRYSPIATFPSSLSKIKAFKRVVEVASGNRGIVNFQKAPTVEIRMFRGIVSFAELCKNLEFVDAVFQFTRGERNIHQLSAVEFLQWLKKTPVNRYMVLKKFIDRCKHIDDLTMTCEIYNEVFNASDPDTIKEILNRSKLQLTNAHVTILNRGKKRTFVLDRDTGKLDIVISNRSKLADVDRLVESRYTRNAFVA